MKTQASGAQIEMLISVFEVLLYSYGFYEIYSIVFSTSISSGARQGHAVLSSIGDKRQHDNESTLFILLLFMKNSLVVNVMKCRDEHPGSEEATRLKPTGSFSPFVL